MDFMQETRSSRLAEFRAKTCPGHRGWAELSSKALRYMAWAASAAVAR